ncbi:bifunctional DNA primase/polymerase [Streptococcus pluranimalium]|uniref:bifunctional DNA primase/polymerase n=1 Tax=Streptococcus pluranimalium TaxID=82348 RepID=UPI003F673AA5
MVSMVDYAINYQKMGYSVIPISKNGKTPLIAFADKPPLTENDIRLAWREHPDANIALRTDTFFVIDVDMHGEINGLENLRNWEHARLIPRTLQATTPSGGRHIYLKKNPNHTISQNIGMIDGVDIKAHVNNYILVPPSNNSKGVYDWDMKHSPADGSITEAPIELIKVLQEMKPTMSEMPSFASGGYSGSNKTAKLFETILLGFGDSGGRNNALAEFVGGLLLRNVDPEITYELAKVANNNTADSLDDREFQRTFKSMLDKEMRRRGGDY